MAAKNDTRSKILDVAETRIRVSGYNGFSFRDIAADVGIKSASVHYHFPTKADLGVKVMHGYTERLLEYLGDPEDNNVSAKALLQRYIDRYHQCLIKDKAMCLACMMGAEASSLPEVVAQEVARFFELNIAWLKTVYQRIDSNEKKKKLKAKALHLLATLQGALIIARTMGNTKIFERISSEFVH